MTDTATLILWIRVLTVGAAICTTSVPVLYSFYPWRTKRLGRLFMLQAMSFAAGVDISAFISIWRPRNMLPVFYMDIVVLLSIAASTSLLAHYMWRLNTTSITKKGRHRRDELQQPDVQHPEEPGTDLAPGSGDAVRGPGSDLGSSGS